jgi:carboxypeptidase PM20D1
MPLLNLASIQERYVPSDKTLEFPPLRGDVQRLQQSITYKTISQDPRMLDTAAFDGFGQFLRDAYPEIFGSLSIDTFSTHTYFLYWPGSSPEAKNYLFIAHQDVVPVDQKSLGQWQHPPFSGALEASLGNSSETETGFVYGRGTLDDKSSLMALMETLESLAFQHFQPTHNLYFCLGQDEEIGGRAGAALVAAHCRQKGLTFEAILDEGGIISTGSIPGLENTPVALIGTAEKGYLSVEISFDVAGGHSSMPNEVTAITQASAFVSAISKGLFEPEFSEPLNGFISHLAPEMPWHLRTIFANRFFTEPLLLNIYQRSHTGRALTNNTAVATLFASGIKDNVVPANARVICNTRILPGTSTQQVLDRYSEIAKEFGGTVAPYTNEGSNATSTSSTDNFEFAALGQAVRTAYADALISPYLTIGGTDSKNFEGLSKNTYRFTPILLNADEIGGIHGTNEHIGVENYRNMVNIYSRTIQLWSAGIFPTH